MSEDVNRLTTQLATLAASMKPRHLAMAKALVEGKSQEAAYRQAGFKSADANSNAAHVIAKNHSILQYKSLFQKIVQVESLPAQLATFQKKREMLWNIVLNCSGQSNGTDDHPASGVDADSFNPRAVISAIAELNKMDGHLGRNSGKEDSNPYAHLTDSQLATRIAELEQSLTPAAGN